MKSLSNLLGRIEKVGSRTCENCESEVPVFKRIDDEGVDHEDSVCLKCDTRKLVDDLPNQDELPAIKIKNWIKAHESIEESIHSSSFNSYHAETLSQQNAKRMSMGYVKKFPKLVKKHSIMFQGDVGVGKSHLSKSIRDQLKDKGYHVLFITSPALMNGIKATYQNNSNQTQEQFMQYIEQVDLLILDDIGSEYVKVDPNGYETWAADIIFQVTNIRQAKPTIFTTNYTSEEMEKKYGRQSKRIISRMLSGAETIKIEGKDYRVGGFE